MKKFTFSSLLVLVAVLFSATNANAQYPQEGLTVLPYGTATPDKPVTLVLDVLATCPDSALFGADTVMMHSGVTIGEDAWQHVVEYNGTGANGWTPRLIPFSPGATIVNAATQDPYGTVTAWDNVIIVVWPDWTAPAGGLADAETVYMHSGVEIDGEAWQKVVPFDGTGANGQTAVMSKIDYQGMTGWMIMMKPADFYGIEEGANVTAINCVFNAGDWDHKGGDWAHDGSAVDFRLQMGDGVPYKYSFTYVPNEFYPIEEGQTIAGINCVFNGGSWDAGEGKAHNETGDGCEDFYAPLGSTGIFNNQAENNVDIYPNPVNDVLNIANVNNVNEIMILDVTGKVVKSQKVNSDKISLNVSDLQRGMYILNIYNDKGIQAKKFMKN
jgi:hypothetical protein